MGAQSAVLVPVPEAEPAVGRHRARLDRAAAWGVPAHVTILYPFVPPLAITAASVAALAAAVASVRAFDCRFPATRWFGPDVLWLAPRPAERFRALTRAVSAAFPAIFPMAAPARMPAAGRCGSTAGPGIWPVHQTMAVAVRTIR